MEIVQYEARYPAAIITLNNPGTRNALSIPMIDSIAAAFGRAESDPGVRAIIFTGAGPGVLCRHGFEELRKALDSLKFDNGGAVWESGEFSYEAMAMTTAEYAAAPHLTDECRASLSAFFAKQCGPRAPNSQPV